MMQVGDIYELNAYADEIKLRGYCIITKKSISDNYCFLLTSSGTCGLVKDIVTSDLSLELISSHNGSLKAGMAEFMDKYYKGE